MPTVSKLRTFGCTAFALVPKEKRNKLKSRAIKCMMVGYSKDRSGYRLLRLLDHEVIYSRDVYFRENEFPRFPARIMSALPEILQRKCGCSHCDDETTMATASVAVILREEEAVTRAILDRRRRQEERTRSHENEIQPSDFLERLTGGS